MNKNYQKIIQNCSIKKLPNKLLTVINNYIQKIWQIQHSGHQLLKEVADLEEKLTYPDHLPDAGTK